MKRLLAFILILSLLPSFASASTTLAGSSCTKVGQVKIQNNKIFTCTKVGKKLKFNNGVENQKTLPTTAIPATIPTTSKDVSITLVDPVAYRTQVTIPVDCSVTKSCAAPTPVRIDQTESCHAKVDATLQKEVNGAWIDVAAAQGWDRIDSCPSTNPYHPWTIATVEVGSTLRWKVFAAGSWEWFGSAFTYRPATPVSQDVLNKRSALTTLANEPASTFKPTSACQMMDAVTPNRSFSTDLSAGFPRVRIRLPNTGHIKALILPIDFADQVGKDDTMKFFGPLAKDVRDFYAAQSYGKLAFDFEIVPNWIRVPFTSKKYGMGGAVGNGDPSGYKKEIIDLLDTTIDFAQYDEVYFLVPKEMPMSVMGWGPAYTTPVYTSHGYTTNGATGGADMYYNIPFVEGSMWKWMAHETGHTFGLYDEDFQHKSATLGNWSIMAMNWSNEAIELGSWDRYLLGWLPENQIQCLPKQSLTTTKIKLSPIVRQDKALKSIMIPLSSTKILIVESRKTEGFDTLSSDHTGVIVYTIDFTKPQLGGGYQIIPRKGSIKSNFVDAALGNGDSVSVDGVSVAVDSLAADGDTVTVSLN
jgi:M6 family metalloprotease-like protein